jgi:hypothetical protein
LFDGGTFIFILVESKMKSESHAATMEKIRILYMLVENLKVRDHWTHKGRYTSNDTKK